MNLKKADEEKEDRLVMLGKIKKALPFANGKQDFF